MSDLNACAFTGRLTKDAVVETVGTKGTQLTKFAIANNTGFGQYAKTNFINVQVWGQAGVAVAQYLVKGKSVGVSGTFENAKWTGQDGVTHDSWTLSCNQVTLLADAKPKAEDATPPTEEVTF